MTTTSENAVSPYRARDFRLYWIAGGIDALGSHSSSIVLPLVAIAITGSPTAVGVVGALAVAGRLAAAPVTAVLADRLPRRSMMIGALLTAAAATGVVFGALLTDTLAIGVLAAAAFVEGAAQSGYESAGAGAIRRLLPADDHRALARMEARNHAAQILGPLLGGALFQVARWLPFLADFVSYVVAAVCVAAIRTDLTPGREEHTSFVGDLRAGLRFVAGQPFLRFVTVWAAGINFAFAALIYAVILISDRRGAAPVSIGLVLTVASIGGLLGALATPRVVQRLRPAVTIVVASWAMVVLVAALVAARQTWSYGLLIGLVFLLSPLVGVLLQARAILVTPDHLQGRVATVIGTVGEVPQMFAPLLAAVLVAHVSPAVVALSCAALLAVLAGYATDNIGLLRTDASPTDPTGTDPTVPGDATPAGGPTSEEDQR